LVSIVRSRTKATEFFFHITENTLQKTGILDTCNSKVRIQTNIRILVLELRQETKTVSLTQVTHASNEQQL
jgi:hypothetical protein